VSKWFSLVCLCAMTLGYIIWSPTQLFLGAIIAFDVCALIVWLDHFVFRRSSKRGRGTR
jgi:hypothetical protein